MDLPDVVSDLFDRYRRVEVVNVVQSLDIDQARVDDPVYGVCTLVKTEGDEYVLVRHTYDLPGVKKTNWTTPCGKVEEGETFEEAAVREVHEETGMGVRVTGLYKVFHYDHLWEGGVERSGTLSCSTEKPCLSRITMRATRSQRCGSSGGFRITSQASSGSTTGI